jgi:uncharacterized membrane protein YecN with MAPEG domain
MDKIQSEVQYTNKTTERALATISSLLESHRWRRIGLVAAWIIILVNVILLVLKKKQIE